MRALEYALSLAQQATARLILLHVLEGFVDDPELTELRDLKVFEYYRHLEEDAERRLATAVPEDARLWARPVKRVAKGKAYRQILALAEEDGADLIVMGVHGKGALNRLLFGSTTHHVIRAARCPVLTIHSA
jgi:nucleotide-binding universal stress UspA family protein